MSSISCWESRKCDIVILHSILLGENDAELCNLRFKNDKCAAMPATSVSVSTRFAYGSFAVFAVLAKTLNWATSQSRHSFHIKTNKSNSYHNCSTLIKHAFIHVRVCLFILIFISTIVIIRQKHPRFLVASAAFISEYLRLKYAWNYDTQWSLENLFNVILKFFTYLYLYIYTYNYV